LSKTYNELLSSLYNDLVRKIVYLKLYTNRACIHYIVLSQGIRSAKIVLTTGEIIIETSELPPTLGSIKNISSIVPNLCKNLSTS
jgi:hypothetical protein